MSGGATETLTPHSTFNTYHHPQPTGRKHGTAAQTNIQIHTYIHAHTEHTPTNKIEEVHAILSTMWTVSGLKPFISNSNFCSSVGHVCLLNPERHRSALTNTPTAHTHIQHRPIKGKERRRGKTQLKSLLTYPWTETSFHCINETFMQIPLQD